MRVCIFGTFDARRHPRTAVLEDGLRAAGLDVVRCNVPWNAPTDLRVAAIQRPHLLLVLGFRLLSSWVRLVRRARHFGPVDVVVVGYLGVLDVHLARLLWRRATVVLDHLAPVQGTVGDRAPGRGMLARIAGLIDRAAVRRTDIVVVDTPEHRLEQANSVVVPVGAEHTWFAARRPHLDADLPLRLVFFGLFTPLQGAPVIAEAVTRVIEAGTPLAVTMIGRGQELATCRELLRARPEVHWVDWAEPEALAEIVAEHHVCFGIFGTTAKAHRVVPNKVFQGAAAGCAILTADTVPQRRALGDAAAFVPAGDAAALSKKIQELSARPEMVEALRVAARERADTNFRPVAVVAPLLEGLRQCRARR